jgi:hypothetical protein
VLIVAFAFVFGFKDICGDVCLAVWPKLSFVFASLPGLKIHRFCSI